MTEKALQQDKENTKSTAEIKNTDQLDNLDDNQPEILEKKEENKKIEVGEK